MGHRAGDKGDRAALDHDYLEHGPELEGILRQSHFLVKSKS